LNYPDAALFENIMRLWEYYGRQPRREELAQPPSTISQSPYKGADALNKRPQLLWPTGAVSTSPAP
jgi:hypothetical protein